MYKFHGFQLSASTPSFLQHISIQDHCPCQQCLPRTSWWLWGSACWWYALFLQEMQRRLNTLVMELSVEVITNLNVGRKILASSHLQMGTIEVARQFISVVVVGGSCCNKTAYNQVIDNVLWMYRVYGSRLAHVLVKISALHVFYMYLNSELFS